MSDAMTREFDVAVIGAGLAGLSAAMTVARLGHGTIVLNDGVPGGELLKVEQIDGVPGYPEGVAGYDLCPITQEQAEGLGVELLMERASRICAEANRWRISAESGDILARGVIIASGTALAKLDVAGEVRLHGKGVSECASCDGPLLRNKVAIVAGGGDSAMQEALVLAGPVEKVIMLVRGEHLTGQAIYKTMVAGNSRIEVRHNTVPIEIIGDREVTHVRAKCLTSGLEQDIKADAIFAFVGLVPNSAVVGDLISLDETGRIKVDSTMRTDMRGICAAGNVRANSPHRAAGAMGDAAAAAVALDRFLATGEWRHA